ncbi:hypothetical protein MS3_00009897 [Schistosoma haematobium]|uniref:Rab9 effector protein with kelch motifs n=2 Tax=Schistosoma haematobium TaxID=6185 RepID=A0A095C9P6_SCHHA|nr:hypothetical protein MS3_00009897 [Schistosoma haematobium]KAH9595173.1 hypothetical protein MS3_00009897 [Schistosoma haematobium]
MHKLLEKLNICGSWCNVSYTLEGKSPLARVGHSTHAVRMKCGNTGNRPLVIMIGGADASGVFNEAYILDIISFMWYTVDLEQTIDFPGLGRYEHSSAILNNQELLIFGGATKTGPLSQLLHLQIHFLSTPENPSIYEKGRITASLTQDRIHTDIQQFIYHPRTQHSSVSLTEYNQLIVFSGGNVGSQPVSDDKVYMYDSEINSWNIIPVEGLPPCSRLGHLILYEFPYELANSNYERIPKGKMYIHGGMVNEKLLDDIYVLNFTNQSDNNLHFKGIWNKLYPTDKLSPLTINHDNAESECEYLDPKCIELTQIPSPSPRAAHGGTILTNKIYEQDTSKILIFGGLSLNGALNDMFCFDTSTRQWTEIRYETSVLPSPRLDFAYCTFSLIVKKDTKENSPMKIIFRSPKDNQYYDDVVNTDEHEDNNDKDQYCQEYLFIHGGMDTHGSMFDDSYLILLSEYQLSNPLNAQTIIHRSSSHGKC